MIELLLIFIISLIGVLLVGIFGVFGGGGFRWNDKEVKHSKFISRAFTGIIFAYFLSFIDPLFWLYAIYFPLGAIFGPGHPEGVAIDRWLMGTNAVMRSHGKDGPHGKLEWWQWEWLRFHEFYALAVRGVLYLNLTHIIANPLAMWIALRIQRVVKMRAGPLHEAFHYSIALISTIGIVLLWLTV